MGVFESFPIDAILATAAAAVLWWAIHAIRRADAARVQAGVAMRENQRRLATQYAVTRVVAGSASLAEAVPELVHAIGPIAGWEAGGLWELDAEAAVLRCVAFCCESPETGEFAAASRGRSFAQGEGVPGRVWASGEPVWIPDVGTEANFPRAREGASVRFHAAIAVPLRAGDDFLGVLEFFCRKIREPDDALLQMMAGIGAQVAQFIEHTRAQERLRASETRLRALADNIPQLAWITDPTGGIEWYNKRWFDYTGTTLEQMQGWGWQAVHHPDHLQRVIEKFKTALATGEAWEDTFPLRGSDGEYRWFLSRASPIRDAGGKIAGWFGSNTDITEMRAIETALRASTEAAQRARAQAEAASRAKDDFLAALSHELRTPLTPVLMCAAVLEKDPTLAGDVREQFAMMRRNVELEARLIDDLLDLTRISHGKLLIHPVPTDAHEVLAQTAEIVHGQTPVGEVITEFVLEAREHWVMADAARLQQVFWNLLKNALKFTPAGGRLTVRSSNPAPGRLDITFTDTGIGIAPGALERIFSAFDQGELDGRHRFGGLGLGLSISRAIVDLHGGELHATSEGPGHGAAFTVSMEAVAAPAQSEPPSAGAPASPGSLRLLVVDDHEPTLKVLVRLLERDGHRAHPAASVREALALADAHECDALISDIGLPDGTGFDLMREIKRRKGWPGIALSGYGMDADLRASRDAGFSAHLVKPIELARLREALASIEQPAAAH